MQKLSSFGRGKKFGLNGHLHASCMQPFNYKSISLHEGTCRCNISPGHVPATFSRVCKCCDFVPATCPCYTSLLHVTSVCTKQVFVAATCSCDMSLQHDPSCLPTFIMYNSGDNYASNFKITCVGNLTLLVQLLPELYNSTPYMIVLITT